MASGQEWRNEKIERRDRTVGRHFSTVGRTLRPPVGDASLAPRARFEVRGRALRRLETYQSLSDARRTLTRASLAPMPREGALQLHDRGRLLSFGGAPRPVIDIAFPCLHIHPQHEVF